MNVEALIVDDDKDIRELMNVVFESLGCLVVAEAENGQEAVDKYREHSPHVTLLDIDMPVMDGIEALKAIKGMNPDAFVVMVTSNTDREAMEACRQAGATHYLRKDIPVEEIVSSIKESWLDRLQEIIRG